MRINRKNFLAYNIHPLDQDKLVQVFVGENPLYTKEREHYIRRFLTPTIKNYLLTKSALNAIENVKIKNSENIRKMLIDSADSAGTFLIDKHQFYRYYMDANGTLTVIQIKTEIVDPDAKELDPWLAKEIAEKFDYTEEMANMAFTYEAFRITKDGIHHPKVEQGIEVPEIDFFLKMLIFIKCTNTQVEVLDPRPGTRKRVRLDNEKYLLDLDQEVTLINSKFNKIVIRDEAFYVNPHGRFQPHGPQNSLVKYIIIDGFYKKGYTRTYK